MPGRYEEITNVDFTLTEPSQMIGSQGRVANGGLSDAIRIDDLPTTAYLYELDMNKIGGAIPCHGHIDS
jgi:hypothetical protein